MGNNVKPQLPLTSVLGEYIAVLNQNEIASPEAEVVHDTIQGLFWSIYSEGQYKLQCLTGEKRFEGITGVTITNGGQEEQNVIIMGSKIDDDTVMITTLKNGTKNNSLLQDATIRVTTKNLQP